MLAAASCGDGDGAPEGRRPVQALWVMDEDHETDFDASFMDPGRGYVAFVNRDGGGGIEKVSYAYRDGKSLLSVQYGEAGRVRSISGDSVTVVFSNYAGSKVDIAVIRKDDMWMATGHETSVDWDAQPARSGARARGAEWYDAVEEWQRPLYEFTEKYGFVLEQFLETGKITAGGAAGVGDDKLREWVADWMEGLGREAYSHVDWSDYEIANVNLKDFLDEAKGVYDIADAFRLNQFYGLATLVANYSTYVDFVEDVFYWGLEAEEWISTNIGLALGALNSGSGDLKATLAWNFYADMDLHAVEPSGAHIYFDDPASRYSDGFLDVDDRAGGSGAAENIYWSRPENGTYEFYVDYFGPSTYNDMSQCGTCKVTIMYKGAGKIFDIPVNEYDFQHVTSITLPAGTYSRAAAGAAPAPRARVTVNRRLPKRPKCRVAG